MKSMLALVAALTMLAAPYARAEEATSETLGTRIDSTVRKVREGTAEALEKTGDALKKAGTKTGEALEKAGNAVSDALKSAADRATP